MRYHTFIGLLVIGIYTQVNEQGNIHIARGRKIRGKVVLAQLAPRLALIVDNVLVDVLSSFASCRKVSLEPKPLP